MMPETSPGNYKEPTPAERLKKAKENRKIRIELFEEDLNAIKNVALGDEVEVTIKATVHQLRLGPEWEDDVTRGELCVKPKDIQVNTKGNEFEELAKDE